MRASLESERRRAGSLGAFRALLLAAVTAVAAALILAVVAFGACLATGCVG